MCPSQKLLQAFDEFKITPQYLDTKQMDCNSFKRYKEKV